MRLTTDQYKQAEGGIITTLETGIHFRTYDVTNPENLTEIMHLNIAEYPRELPSKVSIIMIKFSRSVPTSVKYSKILEKNVPKPKHLENHLKLKDIFSTQSHKKIRLLNRLNISRSSQTRCFMCTEFANNESQKQKRKRKKTQNTSPG